MKTYNSSSARDVHMSPVFSPIPLHGRCEEAGILIEPVVAAHFLCVTVEDNLVLSGHFNADAVVAEALVGMKVENKDESRSLKDNDLVAFMLQGDVSRARGASHTAPHSDSSTCQMC